MTDLLTRAIIANALPGARIVEEGSDAKAVPDSDATAPSLEDLVAKYFDSQGVRTRAGKAVAGDSDGDTSQSDPDVTGDDVEMVNVEIGGVRRTALVDRVKKTVRGVSG